MDCKCTNTTIRGNVAARLGGGIYNPSPNLTNQGCIIANNYATNGGGCASGYYYQCVITNNCAELFGGGAYSPVQLCASLVSGNEARVGGGLYQCTAIYNCTIIGNHAIVQRGRQL